VKKFQSVPSKIDKARKIDLRHVSDRGVSMKNQSSRTHDVKPETLKKSLLDFPDLFLQVHGGHMYCVVSYRNVGSCKSDVRHHCKTIQHTRKVYQKLMVHREESNC